MTSPSKSQEQNPSYRTDPADSPSAPPASPLAARRPSAAMATAPQPGVAS